MEYFFTHNDKLWWLLFKSVEVIKNAGVSNLTSHFPCLFLEIIKVSLLVPLNFHNKKSSCHKRFLKWSFLVLHIKKPTYFHRCTRNQGHTCEIYTQTEDSPKGDFFLTLLDKMLNFLTFQPLFWYSPEFLPINNHLLTHGGHDNL